MKCRSVLTRIDALRTGELDTQEGEEVQEHLARCASCHESVDDVEQFASLVKSLSELKGTSHHDAASLCCDSYDSFEVEGLLVNVAFSKRGIRAIDLSAQSAEAFARKYAERFGRELRHEEVPPHYRKAIEASLHGEKHAEVEVDLESLTEFEQKVLHTILQIPRGEVRTYEWVARKAGNPRAVRAVGNIMAKNPVPLILPCHRVVPSSGGVGNYGYGTEMKKHLLEAEEAPVEEIEQLAKRGVRFIGSRTTKIYCCPTCSYSQSIREENRVGFRSHSEAEKHGYRPCKRCTPAAA